MSDVRSGTRTETFAAEDAPIGVPLKMPERTDRARVIDSVAVTTHQMRTARGVTVQTWVAWTFRTGGGTWMFEPGEKVTAEIVA
jgi:hypothetical protein